MITSIVTVFFVQTNNTTEVLQPNPKRWLNVGGGRRTVDLQAGECLHLALLVGGGAHVRARVLLGDPGHRQHVQHLEALGGQILVQLGGTESGGHKHT